MSFIRRSGLALALLSGFVGTANATWTAVSNTTFSGPVAAVGAGQVLENGFTDLAGSQWSINNAGQAVAVSNSTTPWQTGALLRPASEDTGDVQIVYTFGLPSISALASGDDVYFVARHNRSTTSARAYIGTIHSNGTNYIFTIDPVTGGTLGTGQSSTSTALNALTAGSFYTATVTVVQTNSTTTTISLISVTAAGSSTNLLSAPISFTDTTAALQNVTGSAGHFVYNNTSSYPDLTASATYTDLTSATAYSVTGPTSGVTGSVSAPFQIQPVGPLSAATTFTLSDASGGGTFSPTTVTVPAGTAPGSFTYTPGSNGTHTISSTNNGSLTNPAAVSYSSIVYTTVPVNSAAVKFSPGNWKGDTGRTGSIYRQSWNNGASATFVFNASASPTAILQLANTSTTSLLTYQVNGQQIAAGVTATSSVTLSGLVPSAVNTVKVWLRSSAQSGRWNNGGNTLQVQGFQIDTGSTPGTAPAARPWWLVFGDSISDGEHAAGTSQSAEGSADYMLAYTHLLENAADQLGYDFSNSSCGYDGWLHVGDTTGDVPAFVSVSGSSGGTGGTFSASASRIGLIDQGVSLLDTNGQISAQGAINTLPSLILINLGTNDAIYASNVSDLQASVTKGLTLLRSYAPGVPIGVIVPPGLYYTAAYASGPAYVTALKGGLTAYQAANPADLQVGLIDLGTNFANLLENGFVNSDLVHPNDLAAGLIEAPILAASEKLLLTPVPRYRYR